MNFRKTEYRLKKPKHIFKDIKYKKQFSADFFRACFLYSFSARKKQKLCSRSFYGVHCTFDDRLTIQKSFKTHR